MPGYKATSPPNQSIPETFVVTSHLFCLCLFFFVLFLVTYFDSESDKPWILEKPKGQNKAWRLGQQEISSVIWFSPDVSSEKDPNIETNTKILFNLITC